MLFTFFCEKILLCRLFAVVVLLLPGCVCPLLGQKGVDPPNRDYLMAMARLGEGVPDMLERYGLYDHACNISKFFEINGLKEEDYRLKGGARYKLPVTVYVYNGKSIRSTLNIKDYQQAMRIDQFNENAWKRGLRNDRYRDTRKLWVPWHELNCPDSEGEVPMTPTRIDGSPAKTLGGKGRNFPIFGRKYAETPLVDNRLRGQVYFVVSGHGGPDVGAQGKRAGHTLCEDEYAYDVSLRLVRLLVSHGATAYMVVRDPNDGIRDEPFLKCDKDEVVWGNGAIPLSQKERLAQRTELINNLFDRHRKSGQTHQTLIEIHVDSRSKNAKTDVFFYFRSADNDSRILANRMHKVFLTKYLKTRSQRSYNGTVSPRHLFMLNETVTPRAVYIELGNIRNDWDQQRLVLPNNRQALANWLCEALLAP